MNLDEAQQHCHMHLTPEQQAADKNTPPQQLTKLVNQSLEIIKLVANNPNAEPELLRELAANAYTKIRQGIAGNPNTPTDVLLDLGADFPKQLLNNPVFALLLLENPNLRGTDALAHCLQFDGI